MRWRLALLSGSALVREPDRAASRQEIFLYRTGHYDVCHAGTARHDSVFVALFAAVWL